MSDGNYRNFLRQVSNYFLRGSQLFRKSKDDAHQLVPDLDRRYELIQFSHDHLGHKGTFATTRTLLVRFWWPQIHLDVAWYVRTCHECQIRKTEYFHICQGHSTLRSHVLDGVLRLAIPNRDFPVGCS